VNLDKWNALDAPTRREVLEAAAETEARQWKALEGRIAQNYARMRENGMAIATEIPAEVRAGFRDAARLVVDDWAAKAGPEARALLDAIKPRYERR
jgi:TRAP-type C4-dicarboxylate transport system substrate-binding protein